MLEHKEWNPGLRTLRIGTGERQHQPGQFVRIGLMSGQQLLSRPYSLVNGPKDTHAELVYNLVPEGKLTPLLWPLQAGDSVYVSKQNYGNFVLAELPDLGQHLWCCATGTGIGPYIPMIQDHRTWDRFESVVLLHGVRRSSDLAYRELIKDIADERQGRLHYHPVVSREPDFNGLRGRITTLAAEGRLEQLCQFKINGRDSQFMLCGNAAFIEDMRNLLFAKGLRKNLRREPGNITVERYWG